MKEQREFLPVYKCKADLMSVIRENQIVVVVGETGSGENHANDAVHARGRVHHVWYGWVHLAEASSFDVCSEESFRGIRVRTRSRSWVRDSFEDCTSSDTIIKYMTDGVLLRETLRDSDLDEYSAIIMDEATREVCTRMYFSVFLKKVVARRRDFKLIVTSATLKRIEIFGFFGNVPVFNIPGRTFPVEIMYSKTPVEDYVKAL